MSYYHAGNIALLHWDMGERTFSVTSTQDSQIILAVHYEVSIWEDTISTDLSYIINKSEDGIWKFASPYQLPVQTASEIWAKTYGESQNHSRTDEPAALRRRVRN